MFGAGGGGGFGTSGAGFGTSTPFGSNTAQQQTPAFGAASTTFGASTTGAFGAKPTFGSTTTGGFGAGTSAFGAAKPSVFGAPAAAPAATPAFGAAAPAATSAFGRTTSTTPFGAAPATSVFGAPAAAAPASPFGAAAPAAPTAFGGAFGKPAASPFGAAPAPAPVAGGFGFGAPAPAPATTGLFGAAPAPAASGLFGAAPAATGFGAGPAKFGAPAQPRQGTGNPAWRETRAEDPTGKAGANPGMLQSISAMKEYEGKSHEELRVEDYLLNRKNSSAVTAAGAAGAAPSTGLFGTAFGAAAAAPAPAAGGFSFGAAAAPSASPFGATAGVAAPTASPFGTAFGAPAAAPAVGVFGAVAGATAPAPAATGGLFGAPAPAPATLFGAPAPAPAAGGFSFGAPAAAAPAPAATGFGGLFGATPAPAPAATAAFGAAPAPAAGGFAFGAPAPAAAAGAFGTGATAFGAAPAATAPAAGGFGFGAPAPAAKTAFGAPAPAPSAFGTTTGGLFGSTPAAATPAAGAFSFSKPPAAAAPAPAAAGGGFSFSGGFGAAAAKPAATFGAPAPAAGGLFGSTAAAPAPGGFGFGTAAAPAPATTGAFGGIGTTFGAAAPAPAATFGAPASGGLFGTAAPATGGLFGSTTQQQQQQQQQQRVAVHNQDPYGAAGNPAFGSGALEQKIKGVQNSSQQLAISFERHPQAGSSGGSQGGGAGASAGQASPSLGFAYRRTPRSNAYIQPRGFGGGGATASGKKDGKGGGGGGAAVSSTARLLSEGALTPGPKSGILSPDAYLSGGVKRLNIPTETEERRERFSSSRPLIRSSPATAAIAAPPAEGRSTSSQPDVIGGAASGSGVEEAKGEAATTAATAAAGGATAVPATSSEMNGGGPNRVDFAATSPDGSARRNARGRRGGGGGVVSPPPSTGGIGTDVRAAAGGGGDESLLDASPATGNGRLFQGEGVGGSGGGGGGGNDFAPTLDLEEYKTEPSMVELAKMTKDALRAVSGFVVSRQGYGSIAWKEPVDLRGVDIGTVVAIEHKSVSVYDELAEGEEKPALGEGLNKPTRVTLYNIFPKAADPSEAEKRRYEARVSKNTEKIGAKLVSYDVDIGEWVFDTFHWSRYAMSDDDDDDDDDNDPGAAGKKAADSAKKMPPPPALGRAGRVPRPARGATSSKGQKRAASEGRRSTKLAMPDTDDEGSVADNASDAGGGAREAASTRRRTSVEGEDGKMANSDAAGFDSMDTDTPDVVVDGGDGTAWPDSGRVTSNLFPERDPSQTEHMRSSLFGQEERRTPRKATDVGASGGSGGGGGGSRPLSWARLRPEKVARPPALRNPEDARAAAAFRPAAGGLESKVLQSLANAWKPAAEEVKSDAGRRGAVRAGQAVADLGLRMGRGFRASWGPDGKLFCPRALGGGGRKGFHGVSVSRFDPTPSASDRDVYRLYVEPLRNHLGSAVPFAPPKAERHGAVAAAAASPPRWALPRRRNDRPENYETLVHCIHGYVELHRSAGAAATASSREAGAATEDSPEWVLEQSWRLASAMWGQEEGEGRVQDLPMPGDLQRAADFARAGVCDGGSPAARREAAVGDWLARAVSSCVPSPRGGPSAAAAGGRGDADRETWRRVLELLSVRRVHDAAAAAMAAGLPRLAVMLTAVATQGGGVGRPPARYGSRFLAQQAGQWQAAGADARMPQEAFSVVQLLGREGFRDVGLRGLICKGASGSLRPSLDWMRQLGLCLWFGAGASAGIGGEDGDRDGGSGGGVADAIEAYDALVADGEALSPTARYFLEPTHHESVHLDKVCAELRRVYMPPAGLSLEKSGGEDRGSGRDRCVLRCLLAMYPSRKAGGGGGGGGASGVSLLSALEPMAVTPDVMDYRHSWHLMNVVEALGVAEVQDRAKAAAVTEGLRFQLVSVGLWEWAVYVALTAEGDPDRRAATARELVLRHGYRVLGAPVNSPDAERGRFLEDLGIPRAWLHEAAAVRAGYEHKSAVPSPTYPRESGSPIPTVSSAHDTKLNLLASAGSAELAREAAKEACVLAPSSMFLGGEALSLLAEKLGEIAWLVEEVGSLGREERKSGGGGGAGVGKEFYAYKEIVEAAVEERGAAALRWSRDEVDRLERMWRIVQPSASRVVGAAAAHQTMESFWKNVAPVAAVV